MRSEAAEYADFSKIRYAQCWEDADILIEALNIKEGQNVLSIAAAGDNTFSILAQNPGKVYALDLNPAQIACLDIRKAAYLILEYNEFLELIGVRASRNREAIYNKIKKAMSDEGRKFWDAHIDEIKMGIGHAGKFERYFKIFREKIIPLIHNKERIEKVLLGGDYQERKEFYELKWNNYRWKLLFKVFFSRFVMGKFGRDPSFFRYVKGSVSDKILERTKFALTELDTSKNPYLHWILKGNYGMTLPHALREENFNAIKKNLHKLEYRLQSIEDFIENAERSSIDAFNFSDIFEYMSQDEMERIFRLVLKIGKNGGRIAYWNMLAPRFRPESLKNSIIYLEELSKKLFMKDKAFFYSAFRVEEIKKDN